MFRHLTELASETTLFWANARQAASSEEYDTELFSSLERRIFRNSVVHISWAEVDFYDNLILKIYPKIWTKVSARKKTK